VTCFSSDFWLLTPDFLLYANVFQLPEAAAAVEPIADHKFVSDRKTQIINWNFYERPIWLMQKGTYFNALWLPS